MRLEHPFEPIVDADSKVLILGSFPSIASFEHHFYYAHPRNAFWPIMEQLFDVCLEDVATKKTFLHVKHIALWDAYGSLRREHGNSSDSNLKELQINPINSLLSEYPNIRTLFCNGGKSFEGINRHFKALKPIKLPSTSPAYAAMRFEKKLQQWHVLKDALDAD